jgi:hypothetical protein
MWLEYVAWICLAWYVFIALVCTIGYTQLCVHFSQAYLNNVLTGLQTPTLFKST